ncbi:MAG: hypothetical protein IIA59_06895 [Candidatus Marinimicrobia bacterium]|nr:hypothetical protein [Candidatus Neomarinimicrobiota bacterium]
MDAKIELADTHLEIGKKPEKSNNSGRVAKGIHGEEHIERANEIYLEIELAMDNK